jgi:hypothetical protein
MYVLVDMGLEEVKIATEQEASKGRLSRKGPALIMTVPDEVPERFVLRLVDHVLRDLRLFPRLVAGRPVGRSGNSGAQTDP